MRRIWVKVRRLVRNLPRAMERPNLLNLFIDDYPLIAKLIVRYVCVKFFSKSSYLCANRQRWHEYLFILIPVPVGVVHLQYELKKELFVFETIIKNNLYCSICYETWFFAIHYTFALSEETCFAWCFLLLIFECFSNCL